jgi:hypothetical protein
VALVAAAMLFPVLDWLLLLAVALSALLLVLPPRRASTAVLGGAGLALALVGFRPADVAERATLAWARGSRPPGAGARWTAGCSVTSVR